MDSPILLSSSITVAPGQIAGVGQTPRLQVPSKRAMWLDEIRIAVLTASIPGGMIRARFDLGTLPFMGTYVPIWNLGTFLNPNQETTAYKSYTWRLPKPLYVPAGDLVIPAIQHTGAASVGNVDVQLTYAGRALPEGFPPPAKLSVPWVGSWVGVSRTTGSDFTDRSTEKDLVNATRRVLHLQRFIGQMDTRSNEVPSAILHSAKMRYTLVRMHSSEGAIFVRDPVPFGHLFSAPARDWTVNGTLNPGAYVKAYLTESYASGVEGSMVAIPMISMIGWREEAL